VETEISCHENCAPNKCGAANISDSCTMCREGLQILFSDKLRDPDNLDFLFACGNGKQATDAVEKYLNFQWYVISSYSGGLLINSALTYFVQYKHYSLRDPKILA